MLTDFIKKLRKKPESSRVSFVWITTIIIMLIITALWFNFSVRQNFLTNQTAQLKSNNPSSRTFSKLGSFLKEAEKNFGYFKEGLSQALGNFLAGKDEPKEIPPELKQYLPQQPTSSHLPVSLPKTN